MKPVRAVLVVLALTLGLTGAFACTRIEGILDGIPARAPATPHEAYLASLIEAGLHESALADRWREAATRALDDPMPMEPPFEEIAFYPAEEPTAASYRIMIDRGQSIRISYTAEPADVAGVFLDVYRVEAAGAPTHVANALSGARALEFEPSRAGEFLVRVQVELLRDVRVRLRVVKAAVLAFPVGGRDTRAIQSSFPATPSGWSATRATRARHLPTSTSVSTNEARVPSIRSAFYTSPRATHRVCGPTPSGSASGSERARRHAAVSGRTATSSSSHTPWCGCWVQPEPGFA